MFEVRGQVLQPQHSKSLPHRLQLRPCHTPLRAAGELCRRVTLCCSARLAFLRYNQKVDYHFRPLTESDESIVWGMLMHASHEPTLESVKAQPYLAHYAAGWGRAGNSGFVALVSCAPVGAAWLRLWPDADRGFGYVDDATPELAMAVLPSYQGKRLGTELLTQVLAAAKGFHSAVSLNVRADSPAVRLYQRVGFVKVAGSEIVNRTGGVSFNMINRLER